MPAMEELHVDPLETLYRDHHGWLRAWLRRKLGCTEQAADLAHDTFLRLLATRDVLSALKEPRAYLVTAARHLLIDRSRRQQIRQAYLDQLERQLVACPELMHAPSAETINQVMIGRQLVERHAIAAVELAMQLAGGAGFFRATGLERRFRDIQAARYHPLQAGPQAQYAGSMALGLPVDKVF